MIALLLFGICGLLFIPFKVQYGEYLQGNPKVHRQGKRVYKIVFWAKRWYVSGSAPFKGCPYSACIATDDKTQYEDADALLFHLRGITDEMPPKRDPRQNWILYTHESPMNEPTPSREVDSIFNLTMTYSQTSDITEPYFKVVNRGDIETKAWDLNFERNSIRNKTKLVAWFVSHCKTKGLREKYVSELKKYIKVDVYGKCGNHECPRKTGDCDRLLDEQYKFYLSFENSICNEYMTEKLYRALNIHVVPIVLGGANYTDLLPPNSYIDIKNFTHPRKLAEYLHQLDKDDDLYNSYFEWKKKYRVKGQARQCKLCEYLHKHHGEYHVVPSIAKLWNKDTDCLSPEQYYKGTGFNIHT